MLGVIAYVQDMRTCVMGAWLLEGKELTGLLVGRTSGGILTGVEASEKTIQLIEPIGGIRSLRRPRMALS